MNQGQECMDCVVGDMLEVVHALAHAAQVAAGLPCGEVGEEIAGADGLLGRCLTHRIRLERKAVECKALACLMAAFPAGSSAHVMR